ncbi:sigma-70 family RNA polymerase sigma factor [Paenibacillus ginsengarvi]|uniref:sigma-70 family RNA polymerase sigma factor n=1 Tax=Paenibacillus ginsengarvi TaxID=400777 RepID=UPI0013155357|nr:sigma-70 family RNA polymerase sigma factor [Paenibacillus ginsengarvi]
MPKLVKLAQHGDEEAVFALLQLHMDKLYRIAWIYLRNEQDALEALQETSCRAFVKLGTLKRPEFFSTWIVRIMLNVCMDELKRKKRFASQDVPELAYTEENRETKYMLEQELERLDPRWKQVVVLKYYEGHSLTEISDILDRPVGTVKSWLHKALSALRGAVGKENGIDG